MTDTVTLRWQATSDYQTTFTLPAHTIEQIRRDGLDPANPGHLRQWFTDGDEAQWFEHADTGADFASASDREIATVTITRHP